MENVEDMRLREILHEFGYNYMRDENLFNSSNLRWFYNNLHVRFRRHELYIECIDRIEYILNKSNSYE